MIFMGGMRLELREEQRLSQEELLDQRVEQRQALLQRLALSLREHFREGQDSPREVFPAFLERVVAAAPEQRRTIYAATLQQLPNFLERIVDRAADLAVPNARRLQIFSLRYYYDAQDGIFLEGDEEKERRASFVEVQKALVRPKEVQIDIDQHEEVLRAKPDVVMTGFLQELQRLRRAQAIAEQLQEPVNNLATFTRSFLTERDPQSLRTPLEFLRELSVLESFFPLLADRIQKRLLTNVHKLTSRSTPESFEHAFLNSVGEYVLVGMGVVAPELFSLQHLDAETVKDTRQRCIELGFAGEALDRLFGEVQSKGIYWHQWKTRTVRPGAFTDLRVRAFITETLRGQRAEILQAADYPAFFGEVHALALDRRERGVSKDEQAECDDDILRKIGELFDNTSFQEKLMQLSAKHWYPALDSFFR